MDDENVARKRRPIKSVNSSGGKVYAKTKRTGAEKPFPLLLKLLALFTCCLALLILFIYFSDNKINASHHELNDPPAFEGPLSENDLLGKVDHLLTSQLHGPESLLLHKDSIFTGTSDGKIVELKDDRIVRTVREPRIACTGYDTELACGRPLGMRSFDDNTIVYVDAYLGLFKLDIKTGQTKMLVEGGSLVEGKPLSFLNDLVVLKNRTIIFTDSSSAHPRRDFMLNLMEHSLDGRLLAYDTETKELRVLLRNLAFPNGVEVSPTEDFAVISELTNARILKYHLKGSKVGTTDIFANNLPGLPDNIRLSKNGSFWVAMGQIRKQGKLSVTDFLATRPGVRNLISKLLPSKYLGHLTQLLPGYGLAILIDQNGKIISSLHDPTGSKISSMSEVADTGKALYFGSFHAPYLSKLIYKP